MRPLFAVASDPEQRQSDNEQNVTSKAKKRSPKRARRKSKRTGNTVNDASHSKSRK